jgi:nitrate/nitrite transport system ATP-binding protein
MAMTKSSVQVKNAGQSFRTRKGPFSVLDALIRANPQDELMKILAATRATIDEILEVNIKRPRDRLAHAHDKHFGACQAAIAAFLYNKQFKRAA